MGLGDIFKKKENKKSEEDYLLTEKDTERILEEREVEDKQDEYKPEESKPNEEPIKVKLGPDLLGDIFRGNGDKPDKEFTATTYDVVGLIQKIELDPSTKVRQFTKVKYIGDDYAMFPLNYDEMKEFLPPGKYLVRVVDANRKRSQFGSTTIEIRPDEPEEPMENEIEKEQPATIESNDQSIAERINRLEELVSKAVENKQQDPRDKALDLLLTVAIKNLTDNKNKGVDITSIAKQVTAAIMDQNKVTQDILSKREEFKGQYQLKQLEFDHEKEMAKLTKMINDGTLPVEEREKAGSTIGGYIEKVMSGVSKILKDVQGPLNTLKELQELQMMDRTTNIGEAPQPTKDKAREVDMSELDNQVPVVEEERGYYDENGLFITPNMAGYDARRDPTSNSYDERFDPNSPKYVPPPQPDKIRKSDNKPEQPADNKPEQPKEAPTTD